MLWHIYQQDEDIHLDKLEAFLALYVKGLPGRLARRSAVSGGPGMPVKYGRPLAIDPQTLARAEKHAEAWCLEQGLQADLATALVQFYVNWI
jgi:hypothetical protein